MKHKQPTPRGRQPGKRLTALKTALVAMSLGLTVGTWGILTSPNAQTMQAVVDDGAAQVTISAPAGPTDALATPTSQVAATGTATAQPTATGTTQPTVTATAQPTVTAQPTATAKPPTAPAPVARTRSSK